MLKRWAYAIGVLVLLVALTVTETPAALADKCPNAMNPACPVEVTVQSGETHPGGDGTDHHGGSGTPAPCWEQYVIMSEDEQLIFLEWKGLDSDKYDAYRSKCLPPGPGTDGIMNYNYIFPLQGQFVPPPDPYAIAAEVSARIKLPVPELHFGPDPDQVAVNIPVWLSVSNPGAIRDQQTEQGLTVSMTATIGSVAFSPGEPGREQVVCRGSGASPSSSSDLAHPSCGFTYALRSLPERTHGAGKWSVTATVTWNLDWTASNGQADRIVLTRTNTTALYVGEYRTVMVATR